MISGAAFSVSVASVMGKSKALSRSSSFYGPLLQMEVERSLRVKGQRVTGSAGSVGARVSVSDPMFDPVLSFNIRVYRGAVSIE